jgi:DNA-binding NtrC family response regulator
MESRSKRPKKYSVLVVDDQDNWREILSELLLEEDLKDQFDVVKADSYERALDFIRNQHPPFHVVVTDMRLVDEDPRNEGGLQLVEYLNNRGDETKVIVVTGYPTVATARRALSKLKAYDYLEKRPSDGSQFSPMKFQHLVYQAAQESETLRPEGFNSILQNILLLEPDLEQSMVIRDTLVKEGYEIDLIQDSNENGIEKQLGESTKEYALILLNEAFSGQQIFGALKSKYPNTSIIILTSKDVEPIFAAMREYPILTAVSLPDNQADVNKLRDLIHSAISVKALKYVSMQIVTKDQQEKVVSSNLNAGVTYQCKLLIHDKPIEGATRILLLPSEQSKGKIKLDLFIFAEQMEIKPNTEIFWEFPVTNERPTPCLFYVTPRIVGAKELVIEVEQNQRPLGRISATFEVVAPK